MRAKPHGSQPTERTPSDVEVGTMEGITFFVWRGSSGISLLQLLELVGSARVLESQWIIRYADSAGEPQAAHELNEFSDSEIRFPGSTLQRLVSKGVQLIDGELSAYEADKDNAWLILRAVDSTHWDVESQDVALLARLKEAIPDAEPLPKWSKTI